MMQRNTLQEIWPEILNKILTAGNLVEDERGQNTYELLNLVWRVLNPLESQRPEKMAMGPESVKMYEDEMIDPDKGYFVYTYGNRLRGHFRYNTEEEIDQVADIIVRLRKCDASRRAVAITWNPLTDGDCDEVPCMMLVDFKIRHKLLYTTALWRSHDAYGAIPANFLALKNLASFVAQHIDDVRIGPITVHSISAHIYEGDWVEARRVAGC